MSGNALLLKFGTDFGDTSSKLSELAGNVTRNMAIVGAAAAAASRTLREELTSGAASATKSLLTYTATWENAKAVATVAGEAMKVGFALHHPVLAVGMQLLGNYKYALGAVAAGALTAVEAVKWMGDQVQRVNDIIAGAEKAGVSGTFFQVWTEQAVKARLSVEEMERALQHASQALKPTYSVDGQQNINGMLRYSDQLQNGRGFATESYQAFRDANGDMDKLQTAGALLVQDFQRAAVALDDASLKAQAGQIATELWGDAGTKIAAALAEGKISIADAAKQARDMGTVYSEDLLKATADVNQQLAEAKNRLSNELHPAMEGLVRISNAVLSAWTQIVSKLAEGAHWFNNLDWAGAGEQAGFGPLSDLKLALSDRGKVGAGFKDTLPGWTPRGADNGFTARPANVPLPPTRPSLTTLESTSPHVASSGGKEAAEAKSAVDQYIESLEKANAVAKAELETIGKSNIEKAKSVDLARAEEAAKRDGATLTDAERAKILALADAEGRLKDQTEQTNKAIAERKAMGDYFGNMGESAVEKLIVDHKGLRDILSDIVKELERAAIKWALLGNGFGGSGGGGLFGSLLGGSKGSSGGGLSSLFGLFGGSSSGTSAGLGDIGSFLSTPGVIGFSNGGVVGRDGTPVMGVPPSAFAGARHYADGGAIGIIAHAGEIVLNQAQQKNVASGMGRGGVTVHNYAAGVDVGSFVQRDEMHLTVRGAINANNSGMAGVMRDQQDRAP